MFVHHTLVNGFPAECTIHATTVYSCSLEHSLHAGALTVDDLKRRSGVSDAQLDTEVIEQDFPILAGCFDNYNDYVDVLELKAHERADVRRTEFLENSHLAAMREVLRHWSKPNPAAATYRTLLNAVIRLPAKQGIAENICNFIVDKI